jgi:hypothetical protein
MTGAGPLFGGKGLKKHQNFPLWQKQSLFWTEKNIKFPLIGKKNEFLALLFLMAEAILFLVPSKNRSKLRNPKFLTRFWRDSI